MSNSKKFFFVVNRTQDYTFGNLGITNPTRMFFNFWQKHRDWFAQVVVDAIDVEDAFSATNIASDTEEPFCWWESSRCNILGPMTGSGNAGDLYWCPSEDKLYFCLSMGWAELDLTALTFKNGETDIEVGLTSSRANSLRKHLTELETAKVKVRACEDYQADDLVKAVRSRVRDGNLNLAA